MPILATASLVRKGLTPRERAVALKAEAFRQKIQAAMAQRDRVGEVAVREMGTVFVDAIEAIAPRDTQRFVRAYQEAGNRAGLPPRAVLPVVASRQREKFIEALEKQVEFWDREAARFQYLIDRADAQDAAAGPRKDGRARKLRRNQAWYKKAVRLGRKSVEERERAIATLGDALGSESFLLFDKGRFLNGSKRSGYGKRGKRFRTTIRTKIHGGDGWITTAGPVALLTLHNKESHATIVARAARHGRPVDFALAAVKGVGGARITKKVAREIALVSGLVATDKAA